MWGYCLFVQGLTRASIQIDDLLHTFFIAFRFPGAEADRLTAMSFLVHGFTRCNEEYVAPEAEVIVIQNEISFLASGDDDDNEHTGEEDLF